MPEIRYFFPDFFLALVVDAFCYVKSYIDVFLSILMTDMSNNSMSKVKLVENRCWLTRENYNFERTVTPFYSQHSFDCSLTHLLAYSGDHRKEVCLRWFYSFSPLLAPHCSLRSFARCAVLNALSCSLAALIRLLSALICSLAALICALARCAHSLTRCAHSLARCAHFLARCADSLARLQRSFARSLICALTLEIIKKRSVYKLNTSFS